MLVFAAKIILIGSRSGQARKKKDYLRKFSKTFLLKLRSLTMVFARILSLSFLKLLKKKSKKEESKLSEDYWEKVRKG